MQLAGLKGGKGSKSRITKIKDYNKAENSLHVYKIQNVGCRLPSGHTDATQFKLPEMWWKWSYKLIFRRMNVMSLVFSACIIMIAQQSNHGHNFVLFSVWHFQPFYPLNTTEKMSVLCTLSSLFPHDNWDLTFTEQIYVIWSDCSGWSESKVILMFLAEQLQN